MKTQRNECPRCRECMRTWALEWRRVFAPRARRKALMEAIWYRDNECRSHRLYCEDASRPLHWCV